MGVGKGSVSDIVPGSQPWAEFLALGAARVVVCVVRRTECSWAGLALGCGAHEGLTLLTVK